MTLNILGDATADLAHARSWARQKGALRLPDVDRLLAEYWRLAPKVGIDPAVAAAQSSEETGAWTSDAWNLSANPAGLGITDGGNDYLSWDTGTEAAQAHLTHLAVYAKGYKGAQQMIRYLHLDPRWHKPFEAGYAGKAKTVADLAGTWASDPRYGTNIEAHWKGIRGAVNEPDQTPGTDPPKGIVYLGTGNRFHPRAVDKPIFVVRHVTDDLVLQHTLDWFRDPGSNASAHFVIDRDGTIYQFVSTLDAAWTNGDVKSPRRDIPALNRAVDSGINLNHFCVTIENVATPDTGITDAQLRKNIELGRYINQRYGISPDRSHQLRHSDINSVDRAYCPGPRFPLGDIIKALGGDPERLA